MQGLLGMQVHLAQANLHARHGEAVVLFTTACGQTLRDPAQVTGDRERITCHRCNARVNEAVTAATLRALLWGEMPRMAAGGAFQVEDEWALCRKEGCPDAACMLGMWF